ncbi:hypothetical protein BJV82DRAFT_669687 [Fennellomyces sp. T-0311]|nr:hypothetical protein BJV82DRAFT_669687 [Fennellomyces sp. T-0311]
MPGVMDIQHLLCHDQPPEPFQSSRSSSSVPQPRRRDTTKRRRAISENVQQHNRAIYLPTPQTRTPWTPVEDVLLERGYKEGLSWAMISSTYLPHRSRGCCWGRFKTLQSKHHRQLQQQQQYAR